MPFARQKPKVLVVEDEALLLYAIAEDLGDAGFDVLEATNAETAMRLLDQHSDIDLVFTDVDMPGSMDGLRLCAVVRDRWPPMAIIITSGKQRPAPEKLPPDGIFLPKPYTPAGVVAAMTSLLN